MASAQAALITSAGGGSTTELSTISGTWASAPSVNAGGFNVFAPSGENVWYGNSYFNLDSNGNWSQFSWVGGYCWDGSCTATIDLGGLFSSVGGFMNYAPGGGSPIISALDTGGNVLESYDIAALAAISTTGTNQGAFRGILRNTADIAFFQISGSFLIIHDITLDAGSVPEPGTLALAGLSMAGGLILHRRRRI